MTHPQSGDKLSVAWRLAPPPPNVYDSGNLSFLFADDVPMSIACKRPGTWYGWLAVAWVTLALAAPTCRADDAEPAAIDERYLQELAQRLPSADFHVVPVPPFVVIGDEPAAQVERRAHGTVEWAVLRLQQEYFSRSPQRTIDIWLFKDADSYRRHSQQLFDITPSTPFGYYSEPNRALVMNISTGGGTLVHELVHPLMAANFAQCPAWFNEGLASLYEQCGEREGRIWGYPNWRLRGLQQSHSDRPRGPLRDALSDHVARVLRRRSSGVLRSGPLFVFLPAGSGQAAGVLPAVSRFRRAGSCGIRHAAARAAGT